MEEPSAADTLEGMPGQNQEAGKKSARKGSGSLDDLARTALRAFLIPATPLSTCATC